MVDVVFSWAYFATGPLQMQELLDWLEYLEDGRQQSKVRHKLKDILVIVLFATLANADDWVEIAMFANYY